MRASPGLWTKMLQMLGRSVAGRRRKLLDQCMGQASADTSREHKASRSISSMQQVPAERSFKISSGLGLQQVSAEHSLEAFPSTQHAAAATHSQVADVKVLELPPGGCCVES